MKKIRSTFVRALPLLLLLTASSAFAQDGLGFNDTIELYKQASVQFATAIKSAAVKLAFLLFTIDVAWQVMSRMLKSADAAEIMVFVVMRTMWLGFLLFLINLNGAVDVVKSVIDGFRTLGEDASAVKVLAPTDVFMQAVEIVNRLFNAFSNTSTFGSIGAALKSPFVATALAISALVILIAFALMTSQYIAVVVQMYFYLACYPIALAMGATKYGQDISMKALSSAIVIGVRFLSMYFVLYAAQRATMFMEAEIARVGVDNSSPIFIIVGLASMLAFLSFKIPQMAGDLLSGSASLSGGDVMTATAAGTAVGSMVGGVASTAVGAVSRAAGGKGTVEGALQGVMQMTGINGSSGAASKAGGAIRGLTGSGSESIIGSAIKAAPGAGASTSTPAANAVSAPSAAGSSGSGGGSVQPPAPAESGSSGSASGGASPAGQSSGSSGQAGAAKAGGSSGGATTISSGASTTAQAVGGAGAQPAGSGGTGPARSSTQPKAPPASSITSKAAERVWQEVKTGDSMSGASVNIQAPSD